MPAVLELKNIGKEFYQEGKKIKILEDINFIIEEHEFLAIVGPAGCGKSTLLKIIMGLDKPTKGEALYHNNKINSVDSNMSIIFHSFALLPWLDVLENVELGLEAQGMKKEVRMNKAIRMIQAVGLEGFENAHPRELSTDMKQRVSIARALVTDPEVLLMDEPFSVMDPLMAEGLREELVSLWEDKYVKPEIILMVTHNIEEAVYLADRIIVLTQRPGSVAGEFEIKLPRPRKKRSKEVYKIIDTITALIA